MLRPWQSVLLPDDETVSVSEAGLVLPTASTGTHIHKGVGWSLLLPTGQ